MKEETLRLPALLLAALAATGCITTSGGAPDAGPEPVAGAGPEPVAGAALEGCYRVTGVSIEAETYEAEACISRSGDRLYKMVVDYGADFDHFTESSVGVLTGSQLFEVWQGDTPGYECFLHMFEIESAGTSLSGLRVDARGNVSTQIATWTGSARPPEQDDAGLMTGLYTIESSDEFTGKELVVIRLEHGDQEVYSFRWLGDEAAEPGTIRPIEGVGVREDDTINVVASPGGQEVDSCGLTTYEVLPGGERLEGLYHSVESLFGRTALRYGTETLTRLPDEERQAPEGGE